MAEALRVGIAGLGTVGASVVRVITGKATELTRQCGRELAVRAVSARDRNKDRGIDFGNANWFDDPVELAKSADIDVFVELIGGDEGQPMPASGLHLRPAAMSSPPTRHFLPNTAFRSPRSPKKRACY